MRVSEGERLFGARVVECMWMSEGERLANVVRDGVVSNGEAC